MSACELVVDQHSSVVGTTLYTDPKKPCMKPTGVYLRPNHQSKSLKINVILFLHGWYVSSARDLYEPAKKDNDLTLRQSVMDSRRDTVLIAPWLGLQYKYGQNTLKLGVLGEGNGAQRYLDEILEALQRHRSGPAKSRATVSVGQGSSQGGRENELRGEIGVPERVAKLEIDNLVIACHSGGGALMKQIVNNLGDYAPKLKECWGFDCLYSSGASWGSWMDGQSVEGVRTYIYFANGGTEENFFKLFKHVYGTRKNPISTYARMRNVAPALRAYGTAFDEIAFQNIEEIQSKVVRNDFERIRNEVDPLLDNLDEKEYWRKIKPHIQGHFEVVRRMVLPRILQSTNL